MNTTTDTFEEFRDRMNDYRNRLVRRAARDKDMNLVPVELENDYSRLDDSERLLADRVICEWLQSDDAGTRWDAEFLIKKFIIHSAMKDLKELELRLLRTFAVSAPDRDELAKIKKLIELIRA